MAYSTLSSAETQKIFEQRTMITHSRDPSEKNPTPEGPALDRLQRGLPRLECWTTWQGKHGIVEKWNNGSLRHPISLQPIFQHSIIPIFLSSITPADFKPLKFDPHSRSFPWLSRPKRTGNQPSNKSTVCFKHQPRNKRVVLYS
jgi:hypothetical protein